MKVLESQLVGTRDEEPWTGDVSYEPLELPLAVASEPDGDVISADDWLDEWDSTTQFLPGHTFIFGPHPDPGPPEGYVPPPEPDAPADHGDDDDDSFLVTDEHEIVVSQVDTEPGRKGLGRRLKGLLGRR